MDKDRLRLHSIENPLASPFLWPAVATASTGEWVADMFESFAQSLVGREADHVDFREAQWASYNEIALDLPTMRLREFSRDDCAQPVLICGPFALHGANVADFAPGHSLVEALHRAGLPRLYVTDWRSASPQMRYLAIDHYLADLNVAVDDIGAPVDLIGLCQGGWLALVYAARFPAKVRRLVIAGAPVDTAAAESNLSRIVATLPPVAFEQLVRHGDGRVLGQHMLHLWGPAYQGNDADTALQLSPGMDPQERENIEELFREWYDFTVDLPGVYFTQVVDWLYRDNRIVRGDFVALGRAVDLGQIRVPIYLLAARDDALVAPPQTLATAEHVGTPRGDIATATEPCGHLSLFLGARVLNDRWPRIARWLAADDASKSAAAA